MAKTRVKTAYISYAPAGSKKFKVKIPESPKTTIEKTWELGNFYECQRNGLNNEIWRLFQAGRISGSALDIGANIGNHSIFFAGVCDLDTYAFEPGAEALKRLRANIKSAELAGKVYIVDMAVSNYQGAASLSIPEGDNGMMMAKMADGDDMTVVSLDHFFIHNPEAPNAKIGLLKIDVEGHEFEVLEGAAALIGRDRPVITVETDDFETLAAHAGLFGYKFRSDDKGRPVKFNHTTTYVLLP